MVSCMGTTRFSCTSLAASSGLPAHMTRSDKGPLQTSYYVLSKSRSTPAIQRTTHGGHPTTWDMHTSYPSSHPYGVQESH